MSTLRSIANTLSTEERRAFISYLRQKNRRGDTKNIALFKLICSDKTQELDIQLYGKPSRNAYHALCKRVQDSLLDFIASKSFAGETSEEMEVLKLLLASRILFEHQHYKIAFKTLAKAERLAQQLEVYSILNEIYHTKIQYAHLNTDLDLDEVSKIATENTRLFQQEFHLNLAYATIKAKLQRPHKEQVNTIVTQAFVKFNIQINETLTYKSLYQLMSIITTAAKLQSDYYAIAPFMMKLYDIIHLKKEQADKHLFYHISVLDLMAVTHFRNKDFTSSSQFVNQMELEMRKKNSVFYNRFLDQLTINKALNHNYTGKYKAAISLLTNYKGDSLNIKLSLVMCLFQQGQFNAAYQILKKLHHSDAWYEKKMGWIWVVKKTIIEILMLIELDKLDLVLLHLNRFKRKFYPRLKQLKEERAIAFMRMVGSYYEQPKTVTSMAFKNQVENAFDWIGPEREDIFVMSFYAWLKSKMEQTNLYETTLDLVGKTS